MQHMRTEMNVWRGKNRESERLGKGSRRLQLELADERSFASSTFIPSLHFLTFLVSASSLSSNLPPPDPTLSPPPSLPAPRAHPLLLRHLGQWAQRGRLSESTGMSRSGWWWQREKARRRCNKHLGIPCFTCAEDDGDGARRLVHLSP